MEKHILGAAMILAASDNNLRTWDSITAAAQEYYLRKARAIFSTDTSGTVTGELLATRTEVQAYLIDLFNEEPTS